MTEKLIDPQAAVDFMIAKSKAYAIAEGNKTYMEELRKTIKAEQMMTQNVSMNSAGTDFFTGSPIFRCIAKAPTIRVPMPKAAGSTTG